MSEAAEWAEKLANLEIERRSLDRNDPKQMKRYKEVVKEIRQMKRERKG